MALNVYQVGFLLSGCVLPACIMILIPKRRMTCFIGYNLKNSSNVLVQDTGSCNCATEDGVV